MSFENSLQVQRSWNLQGAFSNGSIVVDKLVPNRFTRIRTPFINTWRSEQVSSTLNWGSQSFSWYLPESLRVVSSIFIRIPLPALNSGEYKDIPGLYAVERVRFLSAGNESYFCELGQYLRDYIESLTNEEAKRFVTTYLGHTGAAASGAARVLMIPLPLPNSAYISRHGADSHGHGIWPCYTGSVRLECQISMAPADSVCKTGASTPASISGNVSMEIHQCDMSADDTLRYSDVRGQYSVITRRMTELSDGFSSAAANVRQKLTQNQPLGCVTELFVIAVPAGTDAGKREIQNMVQATHFSITSDSVTQKSLNTPEKVAMELWNNGFVGNDYCQCPSRLCFAAHAAQAESMWTGGYNMQQSSQITIDLEFAENVDYRLFAIQLQRVTVNSAGLVQASLD
jgi:hypothetical protein